MKFYILIKTQFPFVEVSSDVCLVIFPTIFYIFLSVFRQLSVCIKLENRQIALGILWKEYIKSYL
jgi:hypothetical protein